MRFADDTTENSFLDVVFVEFVEAGNGSVLRGHRPGVVPARKPDQADFPARVPRFDVPTGVATKVVVGFQHSNEGP